MTENEPSKIRYDDFIAVIHPDPAKAEATIMLSGFIGHGAEGQVRIYPDTSLGTWYDVPELDVVHSIAIPEAKLGGSYVWVRANADIKPGSAAGAAADTAGGGPAAAPNMSRSIFCSLQCTTQNGCPQEALLPTPTAHVTMATACTQGCTHLVNCYHPTLACPQHTQGIACTQVACGGPGAGPQFMAAAQPTPTAHVTMATDCTQGCTHLVNCYHPTLACPQHTQPPMCTQVACGGPGAGPQVMAPPAAGNTFWFTGICWCAQPAGGPGAPQHPMAAAADVTVGTAFTPLCTRINCYQQPAPAADVTVGTLFTPLCTRINCYQQPAPAADVTVGTAFTPLCTRINCYNAPATAQMTMWGCFPIPPTVMVNCGNPGVGQGRAGVFTPYGG
jgi:hypothetical protein